MNGWTTPSQVILCLVIECSDGGQSEIRHLMALHGGGFEYFYKKTMVTHVIATNLPDGKVQELKE